MIPGQAHPHSGASIEKGFPGSLKNRDVFAAAYMDVLAAVPGKPFSSGAPPPEPHTACSRVSLNVMSGHLSNVNCKFTREGAR